MLRFSLFRSLRLFFLLMVLSALLMIPGCSSGPLSLLTGGGPNIAANTQVGKENTQTIGVSTQQKFAPNQITLSESVRPQGRPPQVEQVQNQTNNELPPIVWIIFVCLFIVGWVTDTPKTILENFRKK
jgi:ABC-type transport system involved in multi-copper enzyme maturation permease subunit